MPCAGLEQEGEPTIPELVYFSHQKKEVGGKAGLPLQSPTTREAGPQLPRLGLVTYTVVTWFPSLQVGKLFSTLSNP